MSKAREKQLLEAIPEITNFKTVLYIGANKVRAQMLNLFKKENVIILEVWPQNAEDMRQEGYNVIEADVRDLPSLDIGKFDAVIWWHGPEHVEEKKLPAILKAMEQKAKKAAIVACPWGRYEQGAVRGNPYEIHRSHLYPEFFIKLGWSVSTIGKKDRRGSNLLAWKRK